MMQAQPVAGGTSSGFGYREHPMLGRRLLHKGVDFRADTGTPVYAAAPGLVVRAAPWDTYGNIVIIDHGLGVTTRYAHLAKMHVRQGDFVGAGARIGDVGATGRVTGPHLHFEVRYHGEAIDPRLAFVDARPAAEAVEPDGIGHVIAAWSPAPLLVH
jgi:murein DD-endopeptidase MepM/ murein hydrolase activator NlpD